MYGAFQVRPAGQEVKLLLHQGAHYTPEQIEGLDLNGILGRWYAHYLYGVDNGAEREAEVRGRNERIVFEKRERNGDSLPPLRNGGSFEPDADLSPVFGNRRRRSVWDL